MNRPLHWGLIGVGGVGQAHLTSLAELEKERRIRLISVADPFIDRLGDVKASLEQKGVRWHLDFQEMLKKESELDAVSICTPIHLHARMTQACIERGVFAYLEKPPVPLIQQLESLIALDEKRKVAVGFQMISSRWLRQLKRWKCEGALGDIQAIRASAAWPRYNGYYDRAPWAGKMSIDGEPVFDGPATNANAHLLHALMFLAGETLDEFDVPAEVEAELYRARPIESYDVACMRGKLSTGPEFSCAVTHATENMVPYRIELFGEKGRAWLDGNGQSIGNDAGLPNPEGKDANTFLESYRAFVDYVEGKRPRPFTRLSDTRGYVLATNGALLSSEGIHNIPSSDWNTYGKGEEAGYDVIRLADWIAASGRKGALLSDDGVSWARKGKIVPLANVQSVQLSEVSG